MLYQALPDIRINYKKLKLVGIVYLECLYILGICVDVDGSGTDVGGVRSVTDGPDDGVVLLSIAAFISIVSHINQFIINRGQRNNIPLIFTCCRR